MAITFDEVRVGDAAQFRKTINDNFAKCKTSVDTLENQLNGNQSDIYPKNVIIIPYSDSSSEGVHFINPNDTSKRKVLLTQDGIILYDEDGRMTTNVTWESIAEGGGSSTIPVNKGGTGKTTWTAKGVLYASDSGTLANTSAGTAGYLLQSGGDNANPSWRTVIDTTESKTAIGNNNHIPSQRTVLHGIEYMINRTTNVTVAPGETYTTDIGYNTLMARGTKIISADATTTYTDTDVNGSISWLYK